MGEFVTEDWNRPVIKNVINKRCNDIERHNFRENIIEMSLILAFYSEIKLNGIGKKY